MKLLKNIKNLSLVILTALIFQNLFCMEKKNTALKAQNILELPDDMLFEILSFVAGQKYSHRELWQITETELFENINNLRLVNKKFNSVIQKYIDLEKKLNPTKYANLNPQQTYKQFQLDLIEKVIMDRAKEYPNFEKLKKYLSLSKEELDNPITDVNVTKHNVNQAIMLITSIAIDLKAFRWMLETPLLENQRKSLKNPAAISPGSIADIIRDAVKNLEKEIEVFFHMHEITPKVLSSFMLSLKNEPNKILDEKDKKLKNLIAEYKVAEKLVGPNNMKLNSFFEDARKNN